jgi:hypothetical protein
MNYTKIFVIGFHKTGTTSMTKAFQCLDLKVTGPDLDFLEHLKAKNLNKIFSFVERYDVIQDDPWFLLYKEFYQKYPTAAFILTERPSHSWIQSLVGHFGNDSRHAVREFIYQASTADAISNNELFIKRYEKHNLDVKQFFEGKDNFLIFDVTKGHGWKELQDFLRFPKIPKTLITRKDIAYPKTNSKEDRTKNMRAKGFKRKIKGILSKNQSRMLQRSIDFLRYRLF